MISAGIDRKTRREVYRRDGWRCALCDSTQYIQVHHCVPRGEGGTDEIQNLITLCSDCHALAHGMDLRGWGAKKEDVDQAIVEYLADYYAPNWNPWSKDWRREAVEAIARATPEEAAEMGMQATWAEVQAICVYLMEEDPAVLRRFGRPEDGPP